MLCRLGSELEYKYVVRSEDGSVYWKPGCNLCIRIPVNEAESWFPGSIAVRDAWDDSSRYIEVCSTQPALRLELANLLLNDLLFYAYVYVCVARCTIGPAKL